MQPMVREKELSAPHGLFLWLLLMCGCAQASYMDDFKTLFNSPMQEQTPAQARNNPTQWVEDASDSPSAQGAVVWKGGAQTTNRYQRDIAIEVLCTIFGSVGNGILNCQDGVGIDLNARASWNSIRELTLGLGAVPSMFMVFNTGLCIFVTGMLAYAVFVFGASSYDVSQSLSARLSPFLLGRQIFGIGALLPLKSGYSLIQIFIIYLVVQSSYLANYVWANYLIPTLPTSGQAGGVSPSQARNQGLDVSKLQMMLLQRSAQSGQSPQNVCTVVNATPLASNPNVLMGQATITDMFSLAMCAQMLNQWSGTNRFGMANCGGSEVCVGDTQKSEDVQCGKIYFPTSDARDAASAVLTQMMIYAGSYLQSPFVDPSTPSFLSTEGENVFSGCVPAADRASLLPGCDKNCTLSGRLFAFSLQYATNLATTAQAQVASTLAEGAEGASAEDAAFTIDRFASRQGWVSAGRYFWDLAVPRAQQNYTDDACPACVGGALASSTGLSPEKKTYCTALCLIARVQVAEQSSGVKRPGTPSCARVQDSRFAFPAVEGGTPEDLQESNFQKEVQNTRFNTMFPLSERSASTQSEGASLLAWQQLAGVSQTTLTPPDSFTNKPTVSSKSACVFAKQLRSMAKVTNVSTGGDFATRYMLMEVFMAAERLTGLKIFSQPIISSDGKENHFRTLAQSDDFYDARCGCVIDHFDCGEGQLTLEKVRSGFSSCKNSNNAAISGNGQENNFLSVMAQQQCLTISSEGDNWQNAWDPSRAGLYGQILARENIAFIATQNKPYAIDPALNLMRTGGAMMSGAIQYYFATLTDIGTKLNQTTSIYAIISGVVRLLLGFMGNRGYGINFKWFDDLYSRVDDIMDILFQQQKALMEMFLPLGNAVASLIFAQGFVLSVYLPFLAFLYYSFGVIYWVIGVIEAMIAAPLIALGVTHPKGHDILGQSEQTMMLLLNTFIKPFLLVTGLVFAIKASHLLMGLINASFSFAMLEYAKLMVPGNALSIPYSVGTLVNMLSLLGVFLIYTYTCYLALEVSYALIYQIPERLMKWSGGVGDSAGDIKEKVGAIKQGASQTSSQLSDAGRSQRPAEAGRVSAGNPQNSNRNVKQLKALEKKPDA